jgi:thymidylate synthase (FAD)
MKVTLLTYTPDAEKVVAAAARLCYSPTDGSDLFDEMTEDKVDKLLQKLVKSGHYSPFEHANFTFAIDGISRACSHQLVRHRLASYSQKSQR